MIKDVFEFDDDFQCKIINLLINDVDFYFKYTDFIKPSYFTNYLNVQIVKNLKDFYFKYLKSPTKEELRNSFNDPRYTKEQITEYKKQVNHVFNLQVTTVTFIKDAVKVFCKVQNVCVALEKSLDLLENNKLDEVKVLIDKAYEIGEDKEPGHDFFNSFEDRRNTPSREDTIPTLVRGLDKVLNGGLAKGELGILVARPKMGKTTSKVNFSIGALSAGKFVVYYSLEMLFRQIAKIFETRISGIQSSDIKGNEEKVKSKLDKLATAGGLLVIKDYPSGTMSINTLKNDLEYTSLVYKRKPDLVIIDYLTLMKTRNGVTGPEEWSQLAVDLRGLAGEFKLGIWSSLQTNRYGAEKETAEMQDVAKFFDVMGIGDVVISMNQNKAESGVNAGRYYIVASRVGQSFVDVPIIINRDLALIQDLDRAPIVEKNKIISRRVNVNGLK